jgi:hypothetical protein
MGTTKGLTSVNGTAQKRAKSSPGRQSRETFRTTLAKLREWYDRGQASREKGKDFGFADGQRSGAAELLSKARTFANPASGYSRDEFDRLVERCEQAGYAIGFSHVILLLRLPRGKLRADLQARAIAGRWSKRRLGAQVARARARRARRAKQRPPGARPPGGEDRRPDRGAVADCAAVRAVAPAS